MVFNIILLFFSCKKCKYFSNNSYTGVFITPLALILDLCIHIIDCIGDINVDLVKIFVWHSCFLYKLEDLFDGFFQIN